MKKYLWLVLLAGVIPASASAADAVLQKSKGSVQVRTSGAESYYEAKAGDRLFFGDQIVTGDGATAHIVFPNGTAILVKEKADLTLSGRRKDTQIVFNVGEFLIGLKRKLSPGNKFQVRTPAAAASVRGTLFWGKTDETKTTTYACFESSIVIEAQGKSVTLTPGQTVNIPFGAPPADVKTADIPASYIDTFAVDGGLQGLEKLMPQASEKK